jgi:hypothetical protein
MKRSRIDAHGIEPILRVKRLVEIEPNSVRSGDGTDEPSASRHWRITAVHNQWNLRMRNWSCNQDPINSMAHGYK